MRIGIKNKIFLFTTSLFVVVLALLLIIQTFVIGDFFESRRMQAIEDAVGDLVARSFESPEPERELYRLAAEFSMIHNTPFVVIDPEKSFFEQLNASGNTLLVQTDDGQVYSLVVEGFDPDALTRFNDGQWIEFSGFKMDAQMLRAFFIETEGMILDLESTYRESDMPMEEFEQLMAELSNHEVISQHGEIIFNNARNMEAQASQKLIGYHGEQIERFLIENGMDAFFEDDSLRTFDFEDPWTATENRLVARPVFFPGGRNFLLITVVSAANTESTVSIFREFYWINFVVAIFISFIATFIFAGRFSRPIRKMESIAKDMANMNFSRKVEVTTKDEMGSLAHSLNILSESLEDKINALENANASLTDEIEFKTQQEEIRKAFVANVSHELKTPITIMKGLVEGIREGLYNDPEHLESVLDETQRMERLVYDMLEISKYEAKGIALNLGVFSLNESVSRVYRRLKTYAEQKGLSVDLDLDECFINADQDKIEQVLENLVSNAIRYCHSKGHINICVSTLKNKALFKIENSGDPIPEDALEDIWKPFYRIETSRNRKKGGTGLGLVIVKSILEAHHAKFSAENTPQGVQFWFELEAVEDSL